MKVEGMKDEKVVVSQPDIRERARAAGCWLNGRRSRRTGEVPKEESMAAFMAIFHPEIKGKKLKALSPNPSSTEPRRQE